nr:MAG: TIGR02186 family protein [Hyphomicrobiales bacterium]
MKIPVKIPVKRLLPAISLVLLVLVLAVPFKPAYAAQEIVSGVSTDLIEIRSDFTGTEVVVFGALEGTDPATAIQDYDVVVVLRGPDVDLTVRRKERILGIWINREQVSFGEMPSYYFLASTGPIENIAPPPLLTRFQLGAEILGESLDANIGSEDERDFRAAAVRNLARAQLFVETPEGIEFLSQTLFRTRIPVPATVTPGEYHAEVYLFREGSLLTLQSSPVFVDKTGLERRIYEFAFAAPLLYGFAAVFLSCVFGWLGFAVFRPR